MSKYEQSHKRTGLTGGVATAMDIVTLGMFDFRGDRTGKHTVTGDHKRGFVGSTVGNFARGAVMAGMVLGALALTGGLAAIPLIGGIGLAGGVALAGAVGAANAGLGTARWTAETGRNMVSAVFNGFRSGKKNGQEADGPDGQHESIEQKVERGVSAVDGLAGVATALVGARAVKSRLFGGKDKDEAGQDVGAAGDASQQQDAPTRASAGAAPQQPAYLAVLSEFAQRDEQGHMTGEFKMDANDLARDDVRMALTQMHKSEEARQGRIAQGVKNGDPMALHYQDLAVKAVKEGPDYGNPETGEITVRPEHLLNRTTRDHMQSLGEHRQSEMQYEQRLEAKQQREQDKAQRKEVKTQGRDNADFLRQANRQGVETQAVSFDEDIAPVQAQPQKEAEQRGAEQATGREQAANNVTPPEQVREPKSHVNVVTLEQQQTQEREASPAPTTPPPGAKEALEAVRGMGDSAKPPAPKAADTAGREGEQQQPAAKTPPPPATGAKRDAGNAGRTP